MKEHHVYHADTKGRFLPVGPSLFHGSAIFVRFLALLPSSVIKMK